MVTTTAAAQATTVPEVWVFPPGSDNPAPQGQTSDFGPVHNGDYMVLQWNPASILPSIGYACTTLSGLTSAWKVIDANVSTSPFTLHVNFIPTTNGSTTDTSYCHVWFSNSDVGNSVQWQYALDAQEVASTWGAAAALASSTATSAIQTSTSIPYSGVTSLPTITYTAISSVTGGDYHTTTTTTAGVATATTSNDVGPHPTTMAVGYFPFIIAFLGLGIIAAIIFGLWYCRRRRRQRREAALAPVAELSAAPQTHEIDSVQRQEMAHNVKEYYTPVQIRELRGNEAAHEIG